MKKFVELMEILFKEFPLDPKFQGNHSMCLTKDKKLPLIVIWYDGRCYPVECSLDEFDKELPALVAELKASIQQIHTQQTGRKPAEAAEPTKALATPVPANAPKDIFGV